MIRKPYIWIPISFVIVFLAHLIHMFNYNINLIGKKSFGHINNVLKDTQENWYEQLLTYASNFTQPETASFIILLVSSLCSFVLFFLLLEKLEENDKIKHTALFFLVVSPLFIYNATVSQPFVILSILILVTIYFLMLENYLKYLSILTSSIVAFLDPGLFVFFILPILFYILIKKKHSLLIGVVSFISLIITSLRIEKLQFKDAVFSLSYFLEENIAMFGALKAFTFISLILVIISFIYTWKKKREYLPIYTMVFLAFIGSIYIESGYKIILNFLFAYAAAYGLWKLMHLRWELLIIKKCIFFIAIAGVLFSGFFYVNSLYSNSPDKEMVEALSFIKGNSLEHEIVFSDLAKKEWILYFTGRDFCCKNISEDIFKTRDNQVAVEFMENNNISFILVDNETREIMKRESDAMGLLFVMENSKNFRKLKSYEEVNVWVFRENI